MNDIHDATTLACFRERLRNAGVIEEVLKKFKSYLWVQGLQARGGQIIDAKPVLVPRQRNSKESKKEIQENSMPEGWDENPNRLQ